MAEKLGVATTGAEEEKERMFSKEFHYTAAMGDKGKVWAENGGVECSPTRFDIGMFEPNFL